MAELTNPSSEIGPSPTLASPATSNKINMTRLVSVDGANCPAGGNHHWVILSSSSHYSRPHGKGELIEESIQRCKKCQAVRQNVCVLPRGE